MTGEIRRKSGDSDALAKIDKSGTQSKVGMIGTQVGIVYTPAAMASGTTVVNVISADGSPGITLTYDDREELILNYQRTYWEVGIGLYHISRQVGYRPDLLDVVVANLTMGLLKLFGTHWTQNDKETYLDHRAKMLAEATKSGPLSPKQRKEFEKAFPPLSKNKTPSLYQMVTAGFVHAKGWDLRACQDGKLFARFCHLNDYFNDISKHFEAKKTPAAIELIMSMADEFVATTVEIVRWFMAVYYGEVPQHAKEQFQQIFKEPY